MNLEKKIIELYMKPCSLKEISEETGAGILKISKILKEAGVKRSASENYYMHLQKGLHISTDLKLKKMERNGETIRDYLPQS